MGEDEHITSTSTQAATSSRVVFKDEEAFEAKRKRIIADGKDKFQVISDFDFTMTKFWVNGRRGSSCHMVVTESGLFSQEYHEVTTKLREHYYPMEVDSSLPQEKREEMMMEWVTKAHEAMATVGMSKDNIVKAVSTANLELRPGQDLLFKWMEKEEVPLLLFSAGISDVLEEVIKQRSQVPLPSKCEVISNRMEFDKDGNMLGFIGQTYHVFNKHASSAMDNPYFKSNEIKGRHNVLLMGDSLGDPNMSRGIETKETLKLGFLNDKVEERMDEYLEAYDAVILGDGGFDFALSILADFTATS